MFTLHGYIIIEEIHANNRLEIYRGCTSRDQLPVVIKVLKAGMASPVDMSKLIHEYEITRKLDIRGVIKPVRLEWAGLYLALIMEDSGAVSLRKYLQTSRPDLPAFFAIAIQLAETLGELHQKGIIHGNLQPDNMLIHPGTGQMKIIDFSTAILLSRTGQDELTPNTPAGTPAYMSPEQIGRMNRSIDDRSDFYSLGVVFYEILTGQLPFQADDPIQWVHAHLAQKPLYPGEINPDIPPAVSAIIMKLLAKTARERYQSAGGLVADLEECRRQWSQTGVIEPFTPGRVDMSGHFQLPRRLYGREKEIAALTAVFKRVCSGEAGLLLVHGYAGIGKTVLIHEIIKPLSAERCYFISGKFDQLQQNIPYVPFIQAFGDLMRQFMTESRESLAAWKRRLLQALGWSGAVITEVIPEVEWIVGPQPPVEILQPRESQNRFRMVFRNFIRTFAQKEHPLVIFLDDLQWADPASLDLIRYLGENPDSRYLFLIGAYRDNEVTETHPLMITLEELQKLRIPVQLMPLASLDQAHTNQFVADALHCTREQSHSLAEILYRKTGGNPFFLGQLLQTAYDEKILSFSANNGSCEWDQDAIQEMPMTDDVIDLMLAKLQKLPEQTRKVLQLAACIGNTFDLKTLSNAYLRTPGLTLKRLSNAYLWTPGLTVADLWPSIVEGFVLPANDIGRTHYTYCPVKTVPAIDKTIPAIDIEDKYEFLHDRVHQVAYSLIQEEEKKEAHFKIGRVILRLTDQDKLDEKIFNIMDHLNRGLDLIKEPAERIKLAEYNLLAGRKAKAYAAYSSALNYFQSGMDLLPDNAWVDYYQLTYDLYLERSQCEYTCYHFDIAEQLFEILLDKAKTDLERADINVIKIVLNSSLERYHETLYFGSKGLSLLGVNLPLNPGKLYIVKEILLAKWRLRNRKADDFANLPEMTDPVQKKIMILLISQAGAAAMVNPELFALIMLKISNLSIKYGNTDFSSIGYACYSFVAGSVLGNYKKGHEFEKMALKLNEKYDHSSAKGIFHFVIGSLVSHWADHGRTSVNHLRKAVDYGFESGTLMLVGYAFTLLIEIKYFLGVSLEELYKECQSHYNFTKRVELLNYQLLFSKLIGWAGDSDTFDNGDVPNLRMPPVDEDELRDLIKGEIKNIMVYNISKLQLYYLHGDYSCALAIADDVRQNMYAIRGYVFSAEYIFYYSLAITAGYDGLPVNQKRKYRKTLKENQQRMKKWSDSCPSNFLHKYLLVAAEMARLGGNDSEAMALYDQSIQSDHENGFIQNEAIAGELAARFYLARGRDKVAQVYLTDACHGYYRWGAASKARTLQDQYPHLLAEVSKQEEKPDTAEILKNAFQFSSVGDSESTDDLELYTIRKAVRELSEETDQETLLKSFLEIAIENAGADKGYLILEKDEKLFVEAAKESDMYTAAVVTPVPLEKSVNLSQAMVRYVARTLESVVLNDIEQASIFARDPYIAQSRFKSIICLPLLFQSIPVGVLYLENSLMAGVFTPDRLEVLKLLSSQMAYVKKLHTFLDEDTAGEKDETIEPLVEPLTKRELDVLNLIAASMSNKEIARGLELTVNTVKTHVLRIYEKLQVNRRVQAVTRARELKLLKKE